MCKRNSLEIEIAPSRECFSAHGYFSVRCNIDLTRGAAVTEVLVQFTHLCLACCDLNVGLIVLSVTQPCDLFH